MKLINTNRIYYDNDFEKWYFEDGKDFEDAQEVDDNYVKENQDLKQQLTEKDKQLAIREKALELACKNLFDYNNEKYNYFIEQAKENLK